MLVKVVGVVGAGAAPRVGSGRSSTGGDINGHGRPTSALGGDTGGDIDVQRGPGTPDSLDELQTHKGRDPHEEDDGQAEQRAARVAAALQSEAQRDGAERILVVVSHCDFLGHLARALLGLSPAGGAVGTHELSYTYEQAARSPEGRRQPDYFFSHPISARRGSSSMAYLRQYCEGIG